MSKARLSATRRAIRARLKRIDQLAPLCLQERQELAAGWVRPNRRKCGNPKCRCAQGELHETPSFGAQHQGRYVHRGIRPERLQWLEAATERWHAFHKRRTELAKECQELLAQVDRLKELLCVDWQDAVTTPAKRRKD